MGRGNLGRSLARALDARLVKGRAGFARPPAAGIVFITVPDGAVSEVARRLADMNAPARVSFAHTSGALGLDALDPLRGRHAVGSFHPLQSFPAPRPASAFRGITVAIDASTQPLKRRLAALARSLGARPTPVGDRERAVYHAAAVFASNFVDVVFAEGVRELRRLGWSEKDAVGALLPLLDGAVANIHARGPVGALTGPIRRGDAGTVRRHLEVVEEPELYRMLGRVALRIATEAGLEPAAAERTRRALTGSTAATRRRGRI